MVVRELRVVLFACAVACIHGAGCSAESVGGSGTARSGASGGIAGFGGYAGTGAGVPGAGASGAGAASPFGNSASQPTMVVGMPSKCKQPTIVFVVDGSGSMCAPFGNATRWTAVRSVLLDRSQGLLYKLQDRGDFGVLIYDGGIDLTAAGMVTMSPGASPNPMCAGAATLFRAGNPQCPQMVEVAPGRNKAMAIDMAFPQRELGGSTPTDKVMKHEVDTLIAARDPNADPMLHPQFIILATDGQPNDICAGGMGGDGTLQQQNVIAEVDRAAAAGITTYVISMAGGDAALEAHLMVVAQHGDPTNMAAVPFNPMNPQDLLTALTTLLGTAFGCNVS
jgi:hypothetical protein